MKKSARSSKRVPSVAAELLVAQELAPPSPTTPKASASKKRKVAPAVSSDGSDIEVLEATPSRKRREHSPPAPGSPAFEQLPAVSLMGLVDDAVRDVIPSSPLVFGSQPTTKPKRNVTGTGKGKGAGKAKAAEVVNSKKSRRSGRNASVVQASESEEELPAATNKITTRTHKRGGKAPENQPIDSEHELLAPAFPLKQGENASGHQASDSEDSLPPVSSLIALATKRSNDVASPPKEQQPLSPTASMPKVSFPSPAAPDPVHTLVKPAPPVEDHVLGCDPALSIMLSPCPDPVLEPLYKGLPHISRLCELKSFQGTVESLRTPFAEKTGGMSAASVKTILKALLFTKSGSYVNTARVDPALLYVDNSRLRVVDSKSLAICIMTGTVTESFLAASAEAGPRNAPYAIHKVMIAPFEQDFRRDVSVWGHVFDFHVIAGMISAAGFSFATRGEGKGDSWRTPSVPSSPVKPKSSVLKVVSSPLVATSFESTPASRSYDDIIPIYDGRPTKDHGGFGFTDAEFRNLSTWPLYRNGPTEVPEDAVVSVGYTLGTYRGHSGPILSSNIHFVILLALGQ